MSRVTPDEKTLALLAGIRERAEICDAQGAVIGYYQPAKESTSSSRYEPNVTKEELDRYAQEPGARTLGEIMADFRNRP